MYKSTHILVLLLAMLAPSFTLMAMELPGWAYPVVSNNSPVMDNNNTLHVPDSKIALTRQQIAAHGNVVPDWHPDEHFTMPDIVNIGREPQVFACGYCHLPNGAGRPENTSLAGLTSAYIKQQMIAFSRDARPGSESQRLPQTAMIALSKNVSAVEIDEAAAYFASLKPMAFIKVIETAKVPKTVVAGWTLKRVRSGGDEPLGHRIIEMPVDFARFENRDSRTPYVAYVPLGSIQRGAELIATGGGKTQPCITCHGPELKGMADVPRLVGRSPSYLMRQLFDIRNGMRTGAESELMKPIVAQLTVDDMIDIVANLASRKL